MPRWLKRTTFALVVVLALLLLSMLVVPWQIKKQAQQWIAENTTRQLTLERVSFNPFTLKLELGGFALSEQESEDPFISFDRLLLSVSGQSLLRRALILNRLELDAPFVNIELLGDQHFNFSDFIAMATSPDPDDEAAATTTDKRPFLFSLNNIVIRDGRIDLLDNLTSSQARHQASQLNLHVPFVGNIPYLVEVHVEPQLRLLVNGAELTVSGQLLPFHDSLETRLHLELAAVDLPFYAARSPVPLPVLVQEGELDLELDLAYRVSHTEEPQLMLGGLLMLTDVDLRLPEGDELLQFSLLVADLDWANLFQQDINLAALELYDPQLHLDRSPAGNWNLSALYTPEDTDSDAPVDTATTTEDETPLLFTIGTVKLVDGRFHIRDRALSTAVAEELYPVNLNLDKVSNHRHQPTRMHLSLHSQRQTSAEITGELTLNPLSVDMDFALNRLPLAPYYPYLEPWLTRPLSGQLSLTGGAAYAPATDVQFKGVQLQLHDFLVPFGDEDQLALRELAISDAALDLQQHQLTIADILLAGAQVKISRLEDGTWSPGLLLRPQQDDPENTAPAPAEDSPWQFRLEQLRLEQSQFALTDRTLAARPELTLRDINFRIGQLTYPVARQSPYQLTAGIGRRGRISSSGNLIYDPLQMAARLELAAFPLADFNDFMPPELNLAISDGQLTSTLDLTLAHMEEFTGTFAGDVNIARFGLRDPLAAGDLLRWDSLAISGLDGDLKPLRVHIREVALSNYLAAVRITPEGRINLTAFGSAPGQPPATEEEAAASAPQPPAPEQPPADIRIDTLTLQGGTLSFTDEHMGRTFSTTMYDLGGRVSDLRSSKDMLADVDLRGRLENHSPLTIAGKINPLSEELYLDLKFSFKDIDLTTMTPYSGTYLGYVIDRGKLYLDLDYHIENRRIRAGNQVLLDQFTLGGTVASDKATSLPVRLAIALLKDRNGQIRLDIPVSGDLEDPSFSLAGTIFTVLRNLLVRAATAPFSLLTAMLGSDEDFSQVVFPPGLARLDAEEREKLEQLTGVLASRPAFNLEISGFADRATDPEAYRREQLRRLLTEAHLHNLRQGGDAPANPDELIISDELYPELLLQVYEQASFPRPRNILGMLKKLPEEEMEKLLLTHIVVEDQQLEDLARERALAVRNVLEQHNEELASRLFLKKTDVFAPAPSGPGSRVELGIVPR